MTVTTSATVWPCLTYRDARGAIAFLTRAFGFEATAVHESADGSRVEHAELRRPDGGGVMFGSFVEGADSPFKRVQPGGSCVYVVVDDPDALFARATEAGAQVVRELHDTDWGSRGFTVSDPEGNLWDFGTYRGA
jgi:uncharacterized glyoxalase superfamily protein PhnB